MKGLIHYITDPFLKRKNQSVFAKAVAEGIRATFEEMGYHVARRYSKKKGR